MHADFSQIGPFLFAALVVFAIYRRFRRSFGRQPVRRGRMTLRMVLLAAAGCALMPMALRSGQILTAELIGAALGVGLALWGAKRTRFLMYREQLHYIPHTYTGIAISLLFLGRLVFRAAEGYTAARTPHLAHVAGTYPAHPLDPLSMVGNPLTVGMLFVLIGYYVCFYGWVLRKSRQLKPQDIEIAATP
jgi:hypothetical protein